MCASCLSIHPSIPFPDSIKNGEDISYHVITLVSLPGHVNTARRVSTSRQLQKSIVYLSPIFVVLEDEEKKVGSGEQQWLGELQSRSCADDVFYFFLFFFCFSLLFGFAIFFFYSLPTKRVSGFHGNLEPRNPGPAAFSGRIHREWYGRSLFTYST